MNKIIKYTIQDGDSLPSIAQAILGDATLSLQIATLNNLDYPFIGRLGETPQQGVVYPGDSINIPISVVDSANLTKDTNYSETEDCDILINGDDFNLTAYAGGEFETDSYGDLTTVSGSASLRQDLLNRLKTEVGTLLYHPDYGSKLLSLIGTKKDTDWSQKASVEILKTLRSDPRVKEVSGLTVTSIPTGIKLECTVHTDSSNFPLHDKIETQ